MAEQSYDKKRLAHVETPELVSPVIIVEHALAKAMAVHDALGQRGMEIVHKNQFSETALKVDIECEQAILDYLCKIHFPIRVVSEEHGVVECHHNPQYLGVLDGLDGSGVYKEAPGTGRYATMFGIFSGLNPRYEEYLVSGIAEHVAQTVYIGEKGVGAYLVNSNKEKKPIHCADTRILDTSIDIRIDECWETTRTVFSRPLTGYNTSCGKCSAIYYADVATGKASLALECTRKGNLELAVAYGLIREAGGVMVDLNGQDIGKQEYLSFGQEPNDHLPIITAATPELASSLVRYLQDKVG